MLLLGEYVQFLKPQITGNRFNRIPIVYFSLQELNAHWLTYFLSQKYGCEHSHRC